MVAKAYLIKFSWRTMKTSYLEHFHKPCLDLLVYTLVQKLAPLYYSKLEFTNNVIGRYRELAPWRKDFKSAWNDDLRKDQNVDLHDKYRPDPQRWGPQEQDIDLRVPGDMMTTGVKLVKASKSLIYHHLKEKRAVTRQATLRSLEAVKKEAKDLFGLTPTMEAIQRSMRHWDISKKIRDSLWKHAHGTTDSARFGAAYEDTRTGEYARCPNSRRCSDT